MIQATPTTALRSDLLERRFRIISGWPTIQNLADSVNAASLLRTYRGTRRLQPSPSSRQEDSNIVIFIFTGLGPSFWYPPA